jgi:hypothetical protein
MADNFSYGLGSDSLNKYARWFNQRRATGQTVNPWEFRELVKADLDAKAGQGVRLAALAQERENAENILNNRKSEFYRNTQLEKDRMDKSSINTGMSGLSNIVTSLGLSELKSGGKLTKGLSNYLFPDKGGINPSAEGMSSVNPPAAGTVGGSPITLPEIPPLNLTTPSTNTTTGFNMTAPANVPSKYFDPSAIPSNNYVPDFNAGGGGFAPNETQAMLPDVTLGTATTGSDITSPIASGVQPWEVESLTPSSFLPNDVASNLLSKSTNPGSMLTWAVPGADAALEAAGYGTAEAAGAGLGASEVGSLGYMGAEGGVSAGTGATSGLAAGLSSTGVGLAAGAMMAGGPMFGNWAGEQLGIGGERERSIGGGVVGGAAAGATIGSVVPVVGTAVGAVIGGVVGGASQAADTVICSELHRQGFLPSHVRLYDAQYGATLDREAYQGYLTIFTPVAQRMATSSILTAIMRPIGVATAYEMAHRKNPEIEGNILGRIVLKIGLPVCRFVYRFTHGAVVEVA